MTRRALLIAAVPTGAVLLLGAEVLLALNGPKLPEREPFELSGLVEGVTADDPLHMVWIGDSISSGVGASGPDATVPRLVASALDRSVMLDVYASSGERVAGALADQVPSLEALPARPDVIVVEIGANDVTHLTRLDDFRRGYRQLLERASGTGARHVLALGIPAFGTAPRFLQPLRAIVGWRASRLDAEVRAAAASSGATYVDIAGATAAPFDADPDRYYAADDFHPSDAGYRLWAAAVLGGLERVGIS
jgi:lysophospholipase L1-like esterase